MLWDNNMRAGSNPVSCIVVPLILGDSIIGIYGAVNTKHRKPFLMADRRIM